nr:hypothetical protein [uncultured Rhodopila sp.]
MDNGNDLSTAVAQHGGTIGVILTFIGGIWIKLLYWALGRYVRQFDTVQKDISDIKVDLATLKGRFLERDHQ